VPYKFTYLYLVTYSIYYILYYINYILYTAPQVWPAPLADIVCCTNLLTYLLTYLYYMLYTAEYLLMVRLMACKLIPVAADKYVTIHT